jgi:hypothetical protein
MHPMYAAIGCMVSLFSSQCANVCEPGTACDEAVSSAALMHDDAGPSAAADADNATTAGDDRAGHVSCEDKTTGETVSCTGEGIGCCAAPSPVCGTYDTCLAANNGNPMYATYKECDGPEDCSRGERCWQEKGGTMCAASGGQVIKCHVNSECPGESGVCVNGQCSVTGGALASAPRVD